MTPGLADLLACVAAFARSLEGAFDPQRFLDEFSTQAQALVPHDGMMIAYLEDEGRSFSAFARHVGRSNADLSFRNYTIAFDPSGRFPRHSGGHAPVFDGQHQLIVDGLAAPDTEESVRWKAWMNVTGFRSRVGVPLYAGGRVIGGFFMASATPGRFLEEHIGVCRQIADLIGPFVENVVMLQRERRRRQRLEALAALTPVLGASLRLGDVLERLGDAVRPAIDFDVLGLSLLAASGQAFERVGLLMEGQPSTPLTIPIAESSVLPRVQRGEVVVLREAEQELDPKRRVDQGILDAGIRSFLLAPLMFGEEVGGALLIAKQRPRWYDGDDVEIVRVIAGSCVLAVQHQRLAEEQQRVAVAEATAQQLAQRVQSLRGALDERFGFDTIIGRSPAFLAAIGQAKKVAPTDTTVLLTGASGTGKEVLARAIHQASARAEGPFVAVNCAALPETLIESELFGHERGAFTGADRLKRGRFELAGGGTLFLDEVGELAPAVQAKLLRILQDRRYERVGGTSTLTADVRLIAATNRNLEDAVAEQRFREDLFYRLAVFRVHLPSLRERGDDILLLADRFVREFGTRMGRGDVGLSREARDLLLSHRWPGNIRELQNAIERSVILSDGGLISAAQLGVVPVATAQASPEAPAAAHTLPELEKQAIVEALRQAKGNKSEAAAALGLTRTRLYTLLRRYSIS
jgi:Nif-specific regulatory protein